MSTAELEVVRREAKDEEREELERIKKKYKERQKQRQLHDLPNTAEQEKQALMEQALKQELQEKEQIRQKYKQRKQNGQLTTQPTTNTEKQKLIQQAQKQEQQEKEQIRQKLKQRRKYITEETLTEETPPEKEDLYKKALDMDVTDDEDIWNRYLLKKPKQDAESFNPLEEDPLEEVYDDELEIDVFESENLEITELESENWDIEEPESDYPEIEEPKSEYSEIGGLKSEDLDINNFKSEYSDADEFEIDYENVGEFESDDLELDELEGESEELTTAETVDRSALLAKYNIQDVQVDDVDHLLENFDRSLTDENVEKVERNIVEKITNSALSHPKIEWVNVLVFLDEETGEGTIKIFAEYADRSLLKRIISENTEQLEVELMQIALYDVWDVFTTLGVNTDYLESKIDVEVELDRA